MSNVCPNYYKNKPQQNLEFPNYHIVPPPPPPANDEDTFGEPPLLTFQDYTTGTTPIAWHLTVVSACFGRAFDQLLFSKVKFPGGCPGGGRGLFAV